MLLFDETIGFDVQNLPFRISLTISILQSTTLHAIYFSCKFISFRALQRYSATVRFLIMRSQNLSLYLYLYIKYIDIDIEHFLGYANAQIEL